MKITAIVLRTNQILSTEEDNLEYDCDFSIDCDFTVDELPIQFENGVLFDQQRIQVAADETIIPLLPLCDHHDQSNEKMVSSTQSEQRNRSELISSPLNQITTNSETVTLQQEKNDSESSLFSSEEANQTTNNKRSRKKRIHVDRSNWKRRSNQMKRVKEKPYLGFTRSKDRKSVEK